MGLELRTEMCSRSRGYVMRPALSIYYVLYWCSLMGAMHNC